MIELPDVGPTEVVEVGTQLPVLSRPDQPAADAETLATQALAFACLITEDEVNARPALLDWATAATTDDFAPGTSEAFDVPLSLSVSQYSSTADLRISREPPEGVLLTERDAEAQALALLERMAEDPSVQGVDPNTAQRLHLLTGSSDGSSETRLLALDVRLAIGRAYVPAHPVSVNLSDTGHIRSVSVPLLRLYDTGRRVPAVIAEEAADALFLEKATAEVEAQLPGFEVTVTPGRLSYPVPEPGDDAELHWLGTYYARNPTGAAAPRPEPHLMSLSKPTAPLEQP